MNDDLARRIAAAIDREGGVADDAELAGELANDPDARVFADDVVRIDRALRTFPDPVRTDEAWEALATRIEQRVDETLMPMADPTLAPLLDDPDGRPPSAHKVRAPADVKPRDGGAEYSLANLTKLGVKGGPPTPEAAQRRTERAKREQTLPGVGPAAAPAGAMPPPVVAAAIPAPSTSGMSKPVAPSRPLVPAKPVGAPPAAAPSAAPVPARDSVVELDAAELEVASDPPPPLHSARAPEPQVSAKPPPPPASTAPARVEPRRVESRAPTGERTSFPSYETAGSPLTAPPVSLDAERAKRQRAFVVGGSLAAAAVVGLAVVGGVSMMGAPAAEDAVSMAPAQESAAPLGEPSPATVPFGGAGDEVAEAEEAPSPVVTATGSVDQAAAPAGSPGSLYGADWSGDLEPPAERTVAAAPTAEAEPVAAMSGPPRREGRARPRTVRRTSMAVTAAEAPSGSGTARGGSGGGGPAPGAPGTLSREEIVRGLSAVQPQVSACRGARGGVVEVQLTIGGSGRVRNALVVGEFAGTREGSCVARVVRSARFPEFNRDSLSLRYPFRL